MICVGVTVFWLTNASFCPAGPASKMTRTGVRKLVPVITTTVPPAGGPVDGVTVLMVGAVEPGGGGGGGTSLNVICTVLVTLFTVAVTVAMPAVALVSTAVATPLVVVRMVRTSLVSVKVPTSVLNSTAVPLATAWPFTLTVALMFTIELTSGLGLETVRMMVAPVGGVTPPPGGLPAPPVPPLPTDGGAVGDSA